MSPPRGSGRGPAKGAGKGGAPKGGGKGGAPKGRGKAAPSGRGPARNATPAGRSQRSAPGRAAPAKSAPSRGRPSRSPAPVKRPDKGLDGTQVEGRHSVLELLLAGTRRTREILMAEDMDPADILTDIVELAQDLKVPVRYLSKRKLDGESRTEASQGVVAHADALPSRPLRELVAASGSTPPFLVAMDGVTDPGNLGAVIRTAECAGVTGLVLPRHRAVHITPTVTKAAAGAIEHVPMTLVGGLPAAIGEMQQLGITVVGLDAAGEKTLHQVPIGVGPVCLVLGAEGSGLSRLVGQRCDEIVSIPLLGQLSSLNVSTAAALAIYEVVRARTASDATR